MEESNAVSSAAGHRSRLRQRFGRGGLTGMQDYEVLELLLTFAIPRKDVKPLAKFLMDHFGSLPELFNASREELLTVEGVGESTVTLILFVQQLMSRCLEEKVRTKKVFDTQQEICDFLRMKIGCVRKETLMVFFLNSRRHLIDYKIYQGTVDHATIYSREVSETALACRACNVILAHNHPSGDCKPSREDLELTEKLRETFSHLGIKLLDHLIVTQSEVLSLVKTPE